MSKIYEHSGVHLFLLFWKAQHAVNQFGRESIRGSGFGSFSDFVVLEVVYHKGPMPVNTIGQKVMLTSGSITTAVQRLEKKGLVYRQKGLSDGRVVNVHLTDSGTELISKAFKKHSENLEKLFEDFSETEKEQFALLNRKLGFKASKLTN